MERKLLYIQKNRAPLTLKYMSGYLFSCLFYNTKAHTMVNCFNISTRSPDTQETNPGPFPLEVSPRRAPFTRVPRKSSNLTPALHSSRHGSYIHLHVGALTVRGDSDARPPAGRTVLDRAGQQGRQDCPDTATCEGVPRPRGLRPGYGFLSMVLKNHSVNLRSWAEAARDSSCSRWLCCLR